MNRLSVQKVALKKKFKQMLQMLPVRLSTIDSNHNDVVKRNAEINIENYSVYRDCH